MALAFLTATGGLLIGGYLFGVIALGLILSALVDDVLGELELKTSPLPNPARQERSPILATQAPPAISQEPATLLPAALLDESRT